MQEFFEPTYVFDFRDRKNRNDLYSAKVGKPYSLVVYRPGIPEESPIKAEGLRKDDYWLTITLNTERGIQTFDQPYWDMIETCERDYPE